MFAQLYLKQILILPFFHPDRWDLPVSQTPQMHTGRDEERDRLSDLPDDILLSIVGDFGIVRLCRRNRTSCTPCRGQSPRRATWSASSSTYGRRPRSRPPAVAARHHSEEGHVRMAHQPHLAEPLLWAGRRCSSPQQLH